MKLPKEDHYESPIDEPHSVRNVGMEFGLYVRKVLRKRNESLVLLKQPGFRSSPKVPICSRLLIT